MTRTAVGRRRFGRVGPSPPAARRKKFPPPVGFRSPAAIYWVRPRAGRSVVAHRLPFARPRVSGGANGRPSAGGPVRILVRAGLSHDEEFAMAAYMKVGKTIKGESLAEGHK